MSSNESVYFNQYGEIVGRVYDGQSEFEQIIFDAQQVEAIKLIIQKCSDQETHQKN